MPRRQFQLDMPAHGGHQGIAIAMRIALSFVHRTPTPQELQSKYGMSRATAYRWIAAMRAAKGGGRADA